MCSHRTDCPLRGLATETQRIVLMVLLASGQSPWTRAELQREVSGSKDEPIDLSKAIDALYSAGLVHVSDQFVTPTRAAWLMDELKP